MDMALLAAAVLGFVAWRGGFRWSEVRRWLPGLGFLLAVSLGYQLFRWSYFGEALPNTYYLKLAGVPLEVRLLRGAWAFARFAAPQAPVFVVVGDAWEHAGIGANRFVAFVMPLMFVLFGAGVALGLKRLRVRSLSRRALVGGAATVAALLLSNHLVSTEGWRRYLVLERPLHVEGHERFVRQTLRLREQGQVPPHARVAVVWSGIPAYFSDWRMVDLLGYNDPWVARQPPSIPLTAATWRSFRPGHVKLGYEHALEVHQPDLIFQTWRPDGKDWAPELRRRGYERVGPYWVRAER